MMSLRLCELLTLSLTGVVALRIADDADKEPGDAAGKAAIPFAYGSSSGRPADGADGGMKAVGFSCGEQEAASDGGDSQKISDSDALADAEGSPGSRPRTALHPPACIQMSAAGTTIADVKMLPS
jgi:hypothetical protein